MRNHATIPALFETDKYTKPLLISELLCVLVVWKDILLSFPERVNSEESSEILYGNEYLPLDVEIESPCLYSRLSMSVKRPFSSSSWISVS